MKRRQFIQDSALASSALMFPSFSFIDKGTIGLQLYTVRDVINLDVKGVMKQISEFGYKKIETFGYSDGMLFGMKSREFSDYVKSLGMKITSGHYGTGQGRPDAKGTLINGWEKAVADAKEAGQEYMILAFLGEAERKSLDDYKRVCELLNKNGEICKQYGIRIGYHNHAFEFDKIDEKVPYDLMLSLLDPKLVSMELDLYWTVKAGQDPLQYFSQYPGRFEQWHVKDMDKTDSKRNAIVGTGSIDFKNIFTKATQSGMRNFYIEHDTFPPTSLSCARDDFNNLSKLI